MRLWLYEITMIDRDFDAACNTILIGFRLSYLVGQGDSVIQTVVSVAISAMMRIVIEEMIQTPGSTNLYWALLSVPTPLVSMREPFEQELAGVLLAFPDLAKARSAGWTEEEARQRWTRAVTDLANVSNDRSTSLSGLGILQALDTSLYLELARSRLRAAGVTEEELSQLAPSAIVMTDTTMELQRRADQLLKSSLLVAEITDGISNTIMIVETDPSKSVVWTKPDDLEIDLENVINSVVNESAAGFWAAMTAVTKSSEPTCLSCSRTVKTCDPV